MRGISFTGTKNSRGPFRLVGCIGEMLCFEADGCALVIFYIVLAGNGAIEEVACVDLYAGLL